MQIHHTGVMAASWRALAGLLVEQFQPFFGLGADLPRRGAAKAGTAGNRTLDRQHGKDLVGDARLDRLHGGERQVTWWASRNGRPSVRTSQSARSVAVAWPWPAAFFMRATSGCMSRTIPVMAAMDSASAPSASMAPSLSSCMSFW